MALRERELLGKFAKELQERAESFGEVEIMASEDVVSEIRESKIAYRNG